MEFSSLSFLFFLIIALSFYWSVSQKYQWIVLLLASGYFYFSWQPAYGGAVILSTLSSYVLARLMTVWKGKRSFLLLFGLMVHVGILFLFKYFNFFSFTLSELTKVRLPLVEVLLPLGISFYTFQVMGYLIDVYKGVTIPERNIGRFALYMLFFPKLIAGPIEKSTLFLPQIATKHTWNVEQIKSGLKLFAFGLFKKIVIADNLALVVDRAFGSIESYKGLSLVLIVFMYSWQIFADFSGYTDMARGIARLFGYNLMENFRTPYFSTSVRDFWRRWHISLSTWLREYLYIPLGGGRVHLWRVCMNYLIVFLVCGIWHGAAWNFVLWGLMHGVFVVGEKVIDSTVRGRIRFPKALSYVYTYTVICISWVLFRANNLEDAVYIYTNSLEGVKSFIQPNYIWASIIRLFLTNTVEMAITLFALVTIISVELISTKWPIVRLVRKQPFIVRMCIYASVVVCILLLRNVGVTEFIYTQF
jgi:alginate O-acetyltransferase complex protein AlgI